jgi:hypothetical protein
MRVFGYVRAAIPRPEGVAQQEQTIRMPQARILS